MKKALLVMAVMFVAMGVAVAQSPVGVQNPTGAPASGGTPYTPTNTYTYANPTGASGATDVLGAHNGYGRGCVMCHAPHSGANGNGVGTKDAFTGVQALWGQDLTPLYGGTLNFGDNGTYAVTLPAQGQQKAHDANSAILFCLSCHDGSVTKVGMMQNQTVEPLPIVGGHAPTLLGMDGTVAGNYLNDHPVGGNAVVGCGGTYDWDCTGGGTTAISMNGTASAQFLKNYPASFWNTGATPGLGIKLATFGTSVTAVTCTTCHDQHSMTVYRNDNGSYPTAFFVKGQYTPANNGNSVAQFCRNCHGGESNEMHGLTDVPTI